MKKIERVADKVLATNGVRVRPINMKDFEARCGARLGGLRRGLGRNWGFVPMSREEFFADGQGNEA